MKKMIAAVVSAVVVSGGIAVTAAPAEANSPCMSRPEYRKIHVGQSVRTVQRIVGSKGRVSMSSAYLVIRQWKTCSNPYGVGTVGFVNKRVQSKSYFG